MQTLVAYVPLVDREIPLSSFERLIVDRMDIMASDQKKHYEFYAARFQHLDYHIEFVQIQLVEFQFGKDATCIS